MSLRILEMASRPRPANIPLSSAQRQMWFLDQLPRTTTVYNVVHGLRLRGDLDRAALEGSLDAIRRRHDTLRTRFVVVDGQPTQVIDPPSRQGIPNEDLQGLDRTRQWRVVGGVLRRERRTAFDLRNGPVMRARLLQLAPTHHVLVLAWHHIATDGWSEAIFYRELLELYDACRARREPVLPPLSVHYADYAIWQHETHDETRVRAGLEYWTARLAGIPDSSGLPIDGSPQERRTLEGGRCEAFLTSDQLAALTRLARAHNTTLFVPLLTALAALLARYTGAEDVVVGTPVANRTSPHLEGLIGFFVNTLVMRVRVEPRVTFRDLLGQVRRIALDAYRYQDVPFDRVVEAIAPRRDPAMMPLFQVMLHVENYPRHECRLTGLQVERLPDGGRQVGYDLDVRATERDGRLALSWLYNRGLFARWRIEQMSRHYVRVLDAMAADADAHIDDCSLGTEADERRLLEPWNAARRRYERRQGLWAEPLPVVAHEWWKQAGARPDQVAIECGTRRYTYGEVLRQSDRLAHAVAALEPSEQLIGVCTPDRVVTAAAILGVLKAGRGFVPLDPELSDEALGVMAQEAGLGVVLTDMRLRARVARAGAARGLAVDECLDDRPFTPAARAGDTPCYLYFTSSSTGRPKGVAGRLEALDHHLSWIARTLRLSPGVRISQLYKPTFSAYLRDLFAPLCVGGTMCIPENADIVADGGRLVAWLDEARIEVMSCVPTILRAVLRHVDRPDRLRALRHVLVVGEPLLPADVNRWLAAFGRRVQLINLYGTTETGMAKLAHVVSDDDRARGWVPVGRPVDGAAVLVADDRGRPCPDGVVGEIWIWSPFMSRGYYRQPAATMQRFIAGSSPADPDDVVYKTGDLGRFHRSGDLELVGRRDGQVKIRGVRVELSAIETALMEEAGISEAVVTAREDTPGDQRLVAYVVDSRNQTSQELRRSLEARLPASMVPSAFVFLDRLPLSSNGKVNRRALPTPDYSPVSRSRLPRTALEELMCGLFADVLGLEDVNPDDDFFELGGHSLMALRLISRIRLATGLDVDVEHVFHGSSVSALLERVDADALAEQRLIVPLRPSGTLPGLFCAHPEGAEWRYAGLMPYISKDHPMHAVRGPAGAGRGADACLPDLLVTQPAGPYHLFGWGAGGAMAYDIACRLRQRHHQVGLVAAVDADPECGGSSRSDRGELVIWRSRRLDDPWQPFDTWRCRVAERSPCPLTEGRDVRTDRRAWHRAVASLLTTELRALDAAGSGAC